MRVLAARPLSLTELNRLISALNYQSLSVGRIDINAAFLLRRRWFVSQPTPPGRRRVAVETRNSDGQSDFAGVVLKVEDDGRSSVAYRAFKTLPTLWREAPYVWVTAVVENDEALEMGGDSETAHAR